MTAYESLLLRGHDVAAVALAAEPTRGNHAALQRLLGAPAAHRGGRPLPVLALPPCAPPPAGARPGGDASGSGSAIDAALAEWLAASAPAFQELLAALEEHHARRLAWLAGAAARARRQVWWPFTQHGSTADSSVAVVDARAGEDWLVFSSGTTSSSTTSTTSSTTSNSSSTSSTSPFPGPALAPMYDAASSWWTQTCGAGPAALHSEVARAVGAAAGRYAHVLWPEVAHEPGLELTRRILEGPLGAGWASRVFFSDDGSTAVEVALKMAFRAFLARQGLLDAAADATAAMSAGDTSSGNSGSSGSGSPAAARLLPRLDVLALRNNYHGDTLGAMDCAAPSGFNGPLQWAWYAPRGLFLDPPYLAVRDGRWALSLPDWLSAEISSGGGAGSSGGSGAAAAAAAAAFSWASREEAFCPARDRGSPLAAAYESAIDAAIDAHEAAGADGASGADATRRRIAALLIEPVLQGAGGMLCVDPAFQRALVAACRRRGVPVIFDEVFTGCWRLGAPTAGGGILGATPDVACYAKLLTGGAAPLAATVATEEVFAAFGGSDKARALLHGHSYTAYPAGCAAALASLSILESAATNPNLCAPGGRDGGGNGGDGNGTCRAAAQPGGAPCAAPCGALLPFWPDDAVARLSRHPAVAGVVAVGTVLALELRPPPPAAAAAAAQQQQTPGFQSGNCDGGARSAAGGGDSGTSSSSGASSSGSSSGGGGGYLSTGSAAVVAALRARGVFARPLGSTVYVMVTPTTRQEARARLLRDVEAALGAHR